MLRDEDAAVEARQPSPPPQTDREAKPTDREGRPEGGEPSEAERPPAEKPDDAEAREGETDEPEASSASKVLGALKAHPIWTAIGAVVLVAAIVAGVLWYLEARHWESTDDAFVDGRSFSVAPKVSGYVVEVLVTDNQHVTTGQILAKIDQRDYLVARQQSRAQVEAAEATVQSADAQILSGKAQVEESQAQIRSSEASLKFAQDENTRAGELAQRGFGTLQRSQQTTSQQSSADADLIRARAALNASSRQVNVLEAQRASSGASLEQARAQLAQSELNLSYTTVMAAQPGRVVRLTGAKGQLAQAGQAIAIFVPDEAWLTANFKETQLNDMRPGQRVEMTIDAYPGRKLTGHVDSVQPGSGTVFSLLPAQNATGNYVKVVQRVPVKIVFDDLPDDVTIGPGMSVVPSVRVR